MPYKSSSIRLNESQDRRRKLTEEQKIEIKQLYASGNWSLNKLAKRYEVCKKTILLAVNPQSAERAREYRKENWREFQAPKEERTRATREHRRYKQSLYIAGELKQDN
ncbi:MAG: hypothetical protein J6D42_11735 [Clostridia bacterium]|nr:hypothetical protein [Clostridia bacterium]